jgi:NTE family protein
LSDAAADGSGAQRTAFVFCGGAGLGALQVGQLRALVERGIRPDLVTGTSSGALNALVYAADPGMDTVERLERLWLSVRRRDLFGIRPWTIGRGLFGSSPYLATNARLRALLSSSLPIASLEDAKIPIAVVLADTRTRRPVVVREGPAVEVLLASSAVPGLYPPVALDGHEYVDGGLVADPPVGPAVESGATHAYVFPVGWPLADPHAGNAMMRATDAVDWLCWRIAEFELERWSAQCRISLLPTPSTRSISPFDLRAARRLIDEAYALTVEWLDSSSTVPPTAPGRGEGGLPVIGGLGRTGRRLITRVRRS